MKTDKKELIAIALPILQGLLASGHFTQEETVARFDHGEDWKEHGVYRRHISFAVEEAVHLAEELIDACGSAAMETNKREEEPERPLSVQTTPVWRKCRECKTSWGNGDGYCPVCGENKCDWIETPTQKEQQK